VERCRGILQMAESEGTYRDINARIKLLRQMYEKLPPDILERL
jgi:hypothetical protein